MRYWGTESKVEKPGGRKPANQRSTTTKKTTSSRSSSGTRSKVATGGSVQPFLRRMYQHQVVIGGPIQRILLFLAIAGILYAFVLGDAGAIRIAILRHQRAQVDQDISELKHNVAILEREIGRLEEDAFYIEKVARERYGYVRRGERVFKIVPPRTDD